jgi:hypothetical protein
MKCLLYRFWIDRTLDDSQPLSPRTERHLARCPDCRRHHERQARVVRQLGSERVETLVEPSTFLRARILNEVKAAARPATPTAPRWAWATGLAGLLALVVIIVQSRSVPEPGPMARTEAVAPAPPLSAARLMETSARLTDGGRWLQLTTNLDQPLQRELSLVLEDARKVLRALSADFLPGELLAQKE